MTPFTKIWAWTHWPQ